MPVGNWNEPFTMPCRLSIAAASFPQMQPLPVVFEFAARRDRAARRIPKRLPFVERKAISGIAAIGV